MSIEKYELNKSQKHLCERMAKLVKQCRDAGIIILAKSDTIYGYNKKAFKEDLVAPLHDDHSKDYSNPVPYEVMGSIDGAGADDMEYFIKGAFK